MKLLIVEDESSLRELLARALRKEQYVVETASTYAEASDKLAAYSYDCILLDIMLPDGNGLQLLERLRRADKRENVIIISARFHPFPEYTPRYRSSRSKDGWRRIRIQRG